MKCPICSTDNFYEGVLGPSCVNSKCNNFDRSSTFSKSNLVESRIKTGIPEWVGEDCPEYPGFAYLEPRVCGNNSKQPALVYKRDPNVIVFNHGYENDWFACYVFHDEWVRHRGAIDFTSGYTPITAAESYIGKYPDNNHRN